MDSGNWVIRKKLLSQKYLGVLLKQDFSQVICCLGLAVHKPKIVQLFETRFSQLWETHPLPQLNQDTDSVAQILKNKIHDCDEESVGFEHDSTNKLDLSVCELHDHH